MSFPVTLGVSLTNLALIQSPPKPNIAANNFAGGGRDS